MPAGADATRPEVLVAEDQVVRRRPGALPYWAAMISASVPHRPIASPSTSTGPSDSGGSGTSARLSESFVPGWTVSARMAADASPLT